VAEVKGLGGRDALLVVAICLAWAGNFLTSKLALQEFPPLLFTALRLVLLAVLLGRFLRRPAPGQWPRLIAVALCNGVLHFGLNFWALKLSTTLASPAIVLQSYVPMAAVLAWLLLGERVPLRVGVAIAISFTGVMVLGFDPSVLAHPKVMLLMLTSAFFLALGTVLMRNLKGLDMFSQQGWTAVIGIVPLLAWSLLVEPDGWDAVRTATWIGWGGVVYAALIASLVGHGLFYVLTQRHPVAQIAPWFLATPLLATLLGVVALGNVLGPRTWIGGAMVLSGVLVLALRPSLRTG
jgi:O-acetylserine/cysteine efflux transporter